MLKNLFQEDRCKIEISQYDFRKEKPSRSNSHHIVGERRIYTILLRFPKGEATKELAYRLSGKLETIAIDTEGPSALLSTSLHHMRSVESLNSVASNDNDVSRESVLESRAEFIDEQAIIIPITVDIETEMEFSEANATLTFSVFESVDENILGTFFDKPRSGARLLKHLLEDEHIDFALNRHVFEKSAEKSLEITVKRPFTAELRLFEMTDEVALLGVSISCIKTDNGDEDAESFTLKSLSMCVGDSAMKIGIFQVAPLAPLDLPCKIARASTFSAVFEVKLLPTMETRRQLDQVRFRLDAVFDLDHCLYVSFEKEIEFTRFLQPSNSDQLTISFSSTVMPSKPMA